ncbi:polysaccharide biosynthesis/export family protein [Cecembia lonarensis]|uniref:Polysaccharide export protein Wza n=1 Tax=Cecembia lonarensis (strain CCUG 58316 / KCTC 22772 / LW9) TaxID=1225176 RepID=K1LGL0_CECL9|nr:polysaccharide biosynthesis/export family protein [Cecembia lonarensis]EKB51312.1 polysaccharide export protein Wza [Cecembia lonarensis LW9]
MKKLLFLAILSISLFSCAKRNLVYFSDIYQDMEFSVPVEMSNEPRIQVDDLLSITVTSLNPESNMLFNVGVLMPSGDRNNTIVNNPINENYLVDKDGYINYPVIGLINLKGLTKQEAIDKMSGLLNEYVKDPIINIRFMNFKVTVIGEVQTPNSFIIPTEKITILEALGLAGDMTAYGRRENVMIIREKDGVRTATRLNLNDKTILTSPYYYLQQNDVVYVEPYKTKSVQADTNPAQIAIITSTISLATIVILNFRWNN